ncbi:MULTISPECIES: hypothetical protein [unclassified Streptomyces]|uniref:hypothetical protein n=1 Tax=unclassified Streptomyces TaxID=2593676 RepID=UPI002E80DFD3|nr:hypothetical protein [Streptomyces sp. NBC_00589]WTI41464.1 hypothetical protein OIC96_43915 [Streptomyces sp. NBC_00775]WUB24852.1 hypothetical protein OHA51_05810 [Streptomyces sp. NBC_00589]
MALVAAADARPLRRGRCARRWTWIAPSDINNTRLELERLTERGIPLETSRASSPSRDHARPATLRPARLPLAKG